MADFRISFTQMADADVLSSYEWGVDRWGEADARMWLRDLYHIVFKRLTNAPLSCPVAPENEVLQRPARHLVFGRYRILFEVKDDEVIVLRVTGPYSKPR